MLTDLAAKTAGLFMSISLLKPMGGEVSLWMKASPEEVWALVSDVTRIGEFSPETFGRSGRAARPARRGRLLQGPREAQRRGADLLVPCTVTSACRNELFEFSVGTDDERSTTGATGRPQNGGTLVTEYFRLSRPLRAYWLVLQVPARAHQREGHADDARADEGGAGVR